MAFPFPDKSTPLVDQPPSIISQTWFDYFQQQDKKTLSSISNSLGADVALNNTANYFDGPSVAQGASGKWFASGSITVYDPTGPSSFFAKLWDGTTVISSGWITTVAAGFGGAICLSGVIASTAGNLRISCRQPFAATGVMAFNVSGNSKDSTISAIRIA